MRRRLLVLQAFFAAVVFSLAAAGPVGGQRSDFGAPVGSVQGETATASSPHALIGSVATSKRASPSDWSSRLFLPSRGVVAPDGGPVALSADAVPGIRDRESLTFTYDATAPPPRS